MYPLLLISGIPASGKSHFGRWLEKEKLFIHIDAEKDGKIKKLGLEQSWGYCFSHRNATPFLKAVQGLNNPVVFNWGFPVSCLPVINILKRAGFKIWWFDADYDVARAEFIKRGDVPVQRFDIQVPAITQNWAAIETVFSRNIIRTLEADGTRLNPEDIYKRIIDKK